MYFDAMTEWAIRKYRQKHPVGYIAKLIYSIYQNTLLTTIVQFIATGLFTIFIQFKVAVVLRFIAGAFATVNFIFMSVVSEYDNRKMKDYQSKSHISPNATTDIHNLMVKCINSTSHYVHEPEIDFHYVAVEVCTAIYTFIKESVGYDSAYITVMVRNESMSKQIAYANKNSRASATFMNEYPLFTQNTKKPFHTKIFESNDDQIRVLPNKQQIRGNFMWHEPGRAEEREKKIEQYIGIPVMLDDQIVFILQVDIDHPGVFGTTVSAVCHFAETYLQPFADILLIAYSYDLIVENWTSKDHIIV